MRTQLVSCPTPVKSSSSVDDGGDHMRTRRGFSLIELLVVVSIIALLLAILLPVFSGARQKGQSTLCLNNLRQLGQGWHLYADDHDDICPPGRYGNAGGGNGNPANWYEVGNGMKVRPRWIAVMGKYVGIYAFDAPRTDFDRQDYDNKIYQCPTVPDWKDERNHGYGYNYQFLGNARLTAGKYHNFPVNRSKISSFGSTVMATDCMGTAAGVPKASRQSYKNDGTGFNDMGNHGWTLDPPRLTAQSERGSGDPGSPRSGVAPRHLGKSNVVFCDGHAETVLPHAIGYRIRPDGAFADEDPGVLRPNNHWYSLSGRDDDPPLPPS
jgi:prepilin-type N-terminal cleavage/methylation domain-containing protein/prepilin-type processing-associated H-X9-DG protein